MNEQNRWQYRSVQIAIVHVTISPVVKAVHRLLGNGVCVKFQRFQPIDAIDNTPQGSVLGNMADIVNERDMEFTRNVGGIIMSNAEE